AVGSKRDLDGTFGRIVRLLRHDQQPPRGLADFHAPGALPSAGMEARAVLATEAQVALHVAVPPGETRGIGACRPPVIDTGIAAVLHANDALPICRPQDADEAGGLPC